VIAYAFVAWSFLVLRRNEPDMDRPYRVRNGIAVGWIALILSIGIGILYLPGSPAALVWPHEWLIFLGWVLFGAVLLRFATDGSGA
jgi:amino acid transporter